MAIDERGNVFKYNCDKCDFGCMSQQIIDEHMKGHKLVKQTEGDIIIKGEDV